jgi:hypothetical protein
MKAKLLVGFAGLCLMLLSLPMCAQIKPLSANWRIGEASTSVTAANGGHNIWTKTVTVSSGQDVIIVRFSAEADTHNLISAHNRLQLRCKVDGNLCNSHGVTGALGWIVVQNPTNGGTGSAFDEHDNSISHTWCAAIPRVSVATVHTVTIDLGADNGTDFVFTEGENLFIESANYNLANACTAG